VYKPGHPGPRQLQLARAELVDRRGADLLRRAGPRGGASIRDLHDRKASEFAEVTPSSAQGSSRRSNSEYADVVAMFRDLEGLTESSAQFQRQARPDRGAMPAAGRSHRQEVRRRGEPRDDLVQVARVGLVNAVIRFDVHAGSDFVSFAVPTIMGEVRRHFRDNSWSVKVPRRLKELHLRLGAATADLSQRLGRAPTATGARCRAGDGPRRGDRGPGRGQLLQHAVDRQRRQRKRGCARDCRHTRRCR